MHPLPDLHKNGDLSNEGAYKWLAKYQKALTDCDNKVNSIKLFYLEDG